MRSTLAAILSACISTASMAQTSLEPERIIIGPAHTVEEYPHDKQAVRTIDDVHSLLQTVDYVSDEPNYISQTNRGEPLILMIGDRMKAPQDTYANGGDCEDFAALAHDLLTTIGYEPKIIIARGLSKRSGKKTGHAICIFRDGATWSYFSDMNLRRGYHRIEDAVASFYPVWDYYAQALPDPREDRGYRRINVVDRIKKRQLLTTKDPKKHI